MSLIQVSSNQERLQNVSQGKQTFQKGSSFSNYFNNLLDVQPDSEIALHSAQFRVQNREAFDLNGLSQQGNPYSVRMMYAKNEGDYSGAERPPFPTHFPLLSYLPQKRYVDIQDAGVDIAKVLSLSSIPSLQGGFTSNQTITLTGKKQINFDMTLNAGNSGNEPLNIEFFKSRDNKATAEATGLVRKNVGTGSGPSEGVTFSSEMNGIHNIGSITFDTINALATAFSAGVAYPSRPKSHTMALGVKRFTPEGIPDFQAEFAEPTMKPSIHFRDLVTQYGLSPDCIGEYMYVIRGKTKGKGVIQGLPCIDIVKFELNSNKVPEPVVIATGDPLINDSMNIPYSTMLDAASAEWVAAGGTLNQIIAPAGTASPVLKILFAGNKVTFEVNGVQVQSAETVAGAASDVECPINDDVFPLQPYGCLTGASDTMKIVFTPISVGGQKKVSFFGATRNDFDKYVGAGSLIPSAVYNLNAEYQETQPYFLRVEGTTDAIVNTTVIPYDTIVGNYMSNGDASASGTLVIGLGENPSTNIIQEFPNQGVVNPNVEKAFGSNVSAIVFTQPAAGVGFLEGNFVSDLADAASPFLKGIYIRLRNLPNRSTFGSLNSADTDKLISVINKYDYTENQAGEQYPIYNYNENEKLYVALNNPALIQVNKLDFQLVDKSGKEVTDVDETTLVLHLRQRKV